MKIKKEDVVNINPNNNEQKQTIETDKYMSQVFTFKDDADYIDEYGNPRVTDREYIRNGKTFREDAASQLKALAKTNRGRVQQYYIKIDRDGTFINPNGLYEQKAKNRITEYRLSQRRKFVPVSKRCFELYLQFLRTGHERYLLQSQREI